MATGIPYLGSKISLISKSEIRYEGILYTIDTKESTVALAKVRSYGTEDRPTDRPVAPRDETYEYIIFRGADIKDIRVCQPPKPRPTLEGGLPNDPAIVQHSRGPPGAPGAGPPGPAAGAGAPGSDAGANKTYGPIGGPAAPGAFSAAPGSQPAGGQPNADSPVMDLLKDGQSAGSSPAPGVQSGGRPSSRTSGADSRRGRGGFRARGQQRGGVQQAGNFRGQAANRGRGGFQPGRPSAKGKDTLKFDSEYDFEQANEEFKEFLQKFEKTGLEDGKDAAAVEEVEEGEIEEAASGDRKTPSDAQEDAQPCYDKKKSFFDTISCEAMERSKGGRGNRPDWKAEKKLNRETFGVTGNMGRRNWYGGGGFRGRGFNHGGNRGGYGYNRGGFGGYNNGYHNNGYNNGFGGGQGRFNNRGGRGWHNGPSQRGRGRGASRGMSTAEA